MMVLNVYQKLYNEFVYLIAHIILSSQSYLGCIVLKAMIFERSKVDNFWGNPPWGNPLFPYSLGQKQYMEGRDGCMLVYVWVCAYTKYLETLFFSSIMYQ